jgi:CheY-like chemotaxis protein
MNRTVLVVDDMPIIRDPIAATPAAAGYLTLRATTGSKRWICFGCSMPT